MDLNDYQESASKTDWTSKKENEALLISLAGIGQNSTRLWDDYLVHRKEGPSFMRYKEHCSETLGDLLWYCSNVATVLGLKLEEIAKSNLKKTSGHYGRDSDVMSGTLDEEYSEEERFPRFFKVKIEQTIEDDKEVVHLSLEDGTPLGDPLTDNATGDDGYRFHDVFHLAYAAVLGWSPVIRRLMKRKRKSDSQIDEVEDGARASLLEELISLFVFNNAQEHKFFQGVNEIDPTLLRDVCNFVKDREVKHFTSAQWEDSILQGYSAWRTVKENKGGLLVIDINAGQIYVE